MTIKTKTKLTAASHCKSAQVCAFRTIHSIHSCLVFKLIGVLKIFSIYFPFQMVVPNCDWLWLHLAVQQPSCLLFQQRITQLSSVWLTSVKRVSLCSDTMITRKDTVDTQSQIRGVLLLIQSGDQGWVRALLIYDHFLRQSHILILLLSSICWLVRIHQLFAIFSATLHHHIIMLWFSVG